MSRRTVDMYQYNGPQLGRQSKKQKKRKADEEEEEESPSSMSQDRRIERAKNQIYFHCEVDRDSIYDLIKLIREAEEESLMLSYKMRIDPVPIHLHISSFGGSIFAVMGAVDVIKACRVPVYSIIDSATASAGTLLSVVCAKRFIRPSAHMLIHQLSSWCWGKMAEIEDEFQNLQELMLTIKSIYMEHTTIPKKQLDALLKRDIWLNAQKCISYGLVDDVYEA